MNIPEDLKEQIIVEIDRLRSQPFSPIWEMCMTLQGENLQHVYNIAESIILKRDYDYPAGKFVTAICENDLRAAVFGADHINIKLIPLYVQMHSWFQYKA